MQVNPKDTAGKALVAGAKSINKELGPFTAWLAAGVGAGIALVVGSVERLSDFVELGHIRLALLALVAALVAAVFAKLTSAYLAASIAAHHTAVELVKESGLSTAGDALIYLVEVRKAMFLALRKMLNRTLKKTMGGDLTVVPRNLAQIAQILQYLVIVIVLAAGVGAVALAVGLKSPPADLSTDRQASLEGPVTGKLPGAVPVPQGARNGHLEQPRAGIPGALLRIDALDAGLTIWVGSSGKDTEPKKAPTAMLAAESLRSLATLIERSSKAPVDTGTSTVPQERGPAAAHRDPGSAAASGTRRQ
jgi:hypothetical protein